MVATPPKSSLQGIQPASDGGEFRWRSGMGISPELVATRQNETVARCLRGGNVS